MVEHSAVNRVVAGSSPARGATLTPWPPLWRPFLYRPLSSVDRAFASGAKGRRFDPVRGHHRSSKPRMLQTCSIRGFFYVWLLWASRCPFVFWLLHALVSGRYASIHLHAACSTHAFFSNLAGFGGTLCLTHSPPQSLQASRLTPRGANKSARARFSSSSSS